MKAPAIVSALVAGAVATMMLAGPIGAAAAASPSTAPSGDDAITWSVAPATVDGVDKRAWVERTIEPGESVTEYLAVRNLGAGTTTFSLNAADGYFTETGRFNMLKANETSTDAGTWISVADDVTVPSGATEIVPFTITVPQNATPGDHAAGIAASVSSVGTARDGAQIGVDSRIGFRVMTQVTGELAPVIAVSGVDAAYAPSWNPFAPGELSVRYTAENAGNTQLSFGEEAAGAVTTRGDLFPGEERRVTMEPRRVWPLGLISAEVVVQGSVPRGEAIEVAPVTETIVVWAVPWAQLVVLAVIAVVVLSVLISRRRSKASVARLIEEARAEGRRERQETGARS
ncbi:hypothetical protein ASF79_16690 [Agreia sp. Leaf335]|uniref:hypothetical protein n=1 Tax=Agreia sp. Leaf335 TaxID=1736340 RepID=UPI0006F7B6EF|nr:hypothetical protein [Agreia sp. Leaf335]KQR19279.1 hypothetical protein ASF79_16690 [Agreia sp. Leaf335]